MLNKCLTAKNYSTKASSPRVSNMSFTYNCHIQTFIICSSGNCWKFTLHCKCLKIEGLLPRQAIFYPCKV